MSSTEADVRPAPTGQVSRTWAAALAALAVVGVLLAIGLRNATAPNPPGGGVRVLRGGTEIELSGPLSHAMIEPLRAALAAGGKTVQLDSPGGNPAAAQNLAALIRAANADTAITDTCNSDCAAVFLAGAHRWLGPFAQVGLEARPNGTDLLPLYREAGLSDPLLAEIAATSAGQGWFPTTDDMLRDGLATGIAAPDQFALAGFGPAPTAASIRAKLLAIPAYHRLADDDPEGFAADLPLWTHAVLEGQPGTAAFAATRARLNALPAH